MGWLEGKCGVCGKAKSLNGYAECIDCAEERVAAQRLESGIDSDFGPKAAAALDAAVALFPATFGLRAFPNQIFRVSRSASFVSGGAVQVYVQRLHFGEWNDFARGTVREWRSQLVKL